MKVSFIIPLYHGLSLTQAMLASLRDTLPPGLAHEIFRGQGRGPDMQARISGFQNKTVKQG